MSDNAQLLLNGNTWDPDYCAGTWMESTENHADELKMRIIFDNMRELS